MGEGELLKGFMWIDCQPVIRPACEKIIRTKEFKGLVDYLEEYPTIPKVEMNIKIPAGEVDYNPGLYRCVIGNAATEYFVLIQCTGPDFKTSSHGQIDKSEYSTKAKR